MLKGILNERAFTTEGTEGTEGRKSGKRLRGYAQRRGFAAIGHLKVAATDG
jgi:hypothetical protein